MMSDDTDRPSPGAERPPASEPPLPAWAERMGQPAAGASSVGPELEARFAVFVGPRWSTYRRKLQPFFADPSFVPTWNWSAALFSPFWFLYRKLYLAFLLFWFVPSTMLSLLVGDRDMGKPLTPDQLMLPENRPLLLLNVGVMLSSAIAAGGTANYFLWRRGRAALAAVELQQLPGDESLSLLRRVGGVSVTMLLVALVFTLVAGSAFLAGAR